MKKIISVFILALIFISCEKNQEKLIGKWVSSDKSDTLDFVDGSNFYKSTSIVHYDHFDYQLSGDSMKIKYDGDLMILVFPTNHRYFINGDKLTIDFSNKQCYGFSLKEMKYTKE